MEPLFSALHFNSEEMLQLLLSFILGGFLGLEREYRSKAAGFRTITLISLGSCLFTLISLKLGGETNSDRIASNIITGIGFIGAGVIFKGETGVSGLTTASTIWISAAMGMTIASGHYQLAFAGFTLVMLVLLLFENVQNRIDRYHQTRSYRFEFRGHELPSENLEKIIRQSGLKAKKVREYKKGEACIAFWDISGKTSRLDDLNDRFMEQHALTFEW